MGREPPIAVQHGKVRFLGNDSHYIVKRTFDLGSRMAGPGHKRSNRSVILMLALLQVSERGYQCTYSRPRLKALLRALSFRASTQSQ
jgi:hypothetical protein